VSKTGGFVSENKTPRATGPGPGAPETEQDVEKERQGLRELMGSFRRGPESGDDGGFYRNVGRLIIRPLMQPHAPGDKGR
jgi:hypothetical protein